LEVYRAICLGIIYCI